MPLGIFHYQILTEVLEGIHYIYDEKELADTVLETVSQAMNAEGGSLFKILKNDKIVPLASFGAPLDKLKLMTFKKGQGVVGWVAEHAQPVKVDDARRDSRFSTGVDKSSGFTTKTILAAPILARGRPIGIIEFLNRKDGPFAAPDIELVSVVGREIGIAFENAELIKRLDKALAFQKAVLDSLSAGVIVIDEYGKLIRVNPRARVILALKDLPDLSEGGGADFKEVLVRFPTLIAILENLRETKTISQRKEFEVEVLFENKKIGYSTMIVSGFNDVVHGYAVLFQDITELKGKSGG